MIKQSISIKLIFLVLTAFIATSVNAAEKKSPQGMNNIVVTGTRSAESISEIAGTIQVIEGYELQEQMIPGQKISDALTRLIPGIGDSTKQVTDHTQTIRGRKIIVLIDGIPQVESRGISRQLSSISTEHIERIEVVSGSSAVYGSGGAGGIINIITKKAVKNGTYFSTKLGTSISTTSPEKDSMSFSVAQTISGKYNKFDYLGSISHENREGFYDADGDRIAPEPAQISRSDSHTTDILLKLGYDISPAKRMELNTQIYRDKMDSDYAPFYGDPKMSYLGYLGRNLVTSGETKAVKGLSLNDQPYTKRNSINFQFSDDSFFNSKLRFNAYHRTREARFYPFGYGIYIPLGSGAAINDSVVNQSTSKAVVTGLKAVVDKDLTDSYNVVFGVDYEKENGEQEAVSYLSKDFMESNGLEYKKSGSKYEYGPDVDTTKLGLFMQNKYQVNENLTLRLGVRHERIESDIKDYNPVSETWYFPLLRPYLGSLPGTQLKGSTKDYDATLMNAGIIYDISKQMNIFFNYSEGFEIPDIARILRNAVAKGSALEKLQFAKGTSIDDANLDAVKVKNYELGWRGNFNGLNSHLTLFYNTSDQTIAFNSDYSVDLLDQKKRIYGFETAIDYFFSNGWIIGGTYSFTKGETKDENLDKWLDLRVAEVSPQKLNAYIGYAKPGSYDFRIQTKTIFDYDDGEKVSRGKIIKEEIDGYTIVDLIAGFRLPQGRLSVGVMNLFNKDYETVYSQWAKNTYGIMSSTPAQGRTIGISYSIEY